MKKLNFLFVLSIFTLFTQSCGKENPTTEVSTTSQAATSRNAMYDGKDYFAGIFFGVNAYGQSLQFHDAVNEQFQTLPDANRAHVMGQINELLGAIGNANPNFFPQFETEIESKDPVRIKTAIGEGSRAIYEHLELLYPQMQNEVNNMKEEIASQATNDDGQINDEAAQEIINKYSDILSNNILTNNENNVEAFGFAIVWAVYAAAAVHNTIALTANVAVVGAAAIYLAVTFWGPSIDSNQAPSEDPLAIELLINEIAAQ